MRMEIELNEEERTKEFKNTKRVKNYIGNTTGIS
jgi:hypothetical protein